MSTTQGIDIKVTEDGAEKAAQNILKVGDSARTAGASLDSMKTSSKDLEGGLGELGSALDQIKGALATIGIAIGTKELYKLGQAYHELKDQINDAKNALLELQKTQVTIVRGTGILNPKITAETLTQPAGTSSTGGASPAFGGDLKQQSEAVGQAIDAVGGGTDKVKLEWDQLALAIQAALKDGSVGTKTLQANIRALGTAIEGVTPESEKLNEAFDALEEGVSKAVKDGTTGLTEMGRVATQTGDAEAAAAAKAAGEQTKLAEAVKLNASSYSELSKWTTISVEELLKAAEASQNATEAEAAANREKLKSVDLEKHILDVAQKSASNISTVVPVYKALSEAAKGYGVDLETIDRIATRVGEDQQKSFVKWLGTLRNGIVTGKQTYDLMKENGDVAAILARGIEKVSVASSGNMRSVQDQAHALADLAIKTTTQTNIQQGYQHTLEPSDAATQKLAGATAKYGEVLVRTQTQLAPVAMTQMEMWEAFKRGALEVDEADETVEHGLVRLQNAIKIYIGRVGEQINTNKLLAGAIRFVIDNMEAVARVVTVLGAAIGGIAIVNLIAKFVTLKSVVGAALLALVAFSDKLTFTIDGFANVVSGAQILQAGLKTLADVVNALTVYWQNLTKEWSPEIVDTVKVALGVLAITITGAVFPALAILLAAVTALTLEYLAIRYVIAAATGKLDEFKQEVLDAAQFIKDKFVTNLAEANKTLTDTSKATDTAKTDMDKLKESVGSISGAVEDMDGKIGKTFTQTLPTGASAAVAALGKVEKATKQVYDATGGYTKSVEAMGNQVAQTSKSNETWYDTWTTQAEHDLATLQAQEEKASIARRTAASPDGTFTGGFQTPAGNLADAKQAATNAYAPGIAALQAQVDLQQRTSDLKAAQAGIANAKSPLDLLQAQLALKQAQQAEAVANAKGAPVRAIQQVGPATITTRGTGYATGGLFDVGGSGGTDSQPTAFMATPGEKVGVFTPDQWSKFVSGQENPWWMGETPHGTLPTSAGGASGGVQAAPRGPGGGGSTYQRPPLSVTMNVRSPDSGSFRRDQQQIMTTLTGRLRAAQSKLPGG